ncbi:Dam family site-specific DNA-(adenine-N6)-methyltransferase [Afipia massiliensis]|uniref:site-specific DNA-methyltransferase (adenine-specific) n=1 Tax=Afipia massiliensis TaxID=211460 RepID=A0A4U6BLS8_9BRAD|nr:Dam family site-specific DNA-(adenine-N6)-methyltransferase [Afipia massiliensis]
MTTPNEKSSHGPSFLRWAGSKRQSLSSLTKAYRDCEREYIEPFAGSAALFFFLEPKSALLADLNGHLINALRWVRDEPTLVHRRLSRMRRDAEQYYYSRKRFNKLLPYGLESAVLFIYLNRNCFNGLWRTNLSGEFNVPFGGTEMGANPPLELLQSCSAALNRARLRHQDFRKTIGDVAERSFIYADPPYFTSTERTFVEYGKKSFGRDDLVDLLNGLKLADKRGAHIALTYNDSIPLDLLPRRWKLLKFKVTRNVGGFAGSRKKQTEILITNVD